MMVTSLRRRERRPTGESWRIAFVSACAILFVVLAFGRGPAGDTHEAILTALRELDTAHASLQRDVLQARAGLLRNYDPLVESVVSLHSAVSTLTLLSPQADMDNSVALKTLLGNVNASINRDEMLVEEFKTRNALLQNSLSIFSQILTQMHANPSQAIPHEANSSNDLGNLMMQFAADPRSDAGRQIRTHFDRFLISDLAFAPDLRTLVTHGRMVLATLPTVDDMISEIQASDTSARARDFQREYLDGYSIVSTHASWSRTFLGSVAVVLCGYVSLLVYRLRSQTERLRQRLDFESTISEVKARLANPSVEDFATAIAKALDILKRYFDADCYAFVILSTDTGEIEDIYRETQDGASSVNGLVLDFLQHIKRSRPVARTDRNYFFYRNLQQQNQLAYSRDAMSRGVAIGTEIDTRSAAMLVFEYDDSRPKASGEEIGLLQSAVDMLARCIEAYRGLQEREALEHRLEHAQRLEAVGTLAGGIAHEFNNILGAILGYGEMALQMLKRTSPTRHYIQEIVSSGERAKKIIDQILTFSRKRERTSKPFDVVEAIADILPLLKVSLPGAFDLTARLPDKPLVIVGNPIEIQQIIMNLCKNASDASSDSGKAQIEVSSVDIKSSRLLSHGELPAGSYVVLSVSDQGVGIPEGVLPHIFEPFFTTRANSGGTGLGLAAVHGNVAGLAGHINVESQLGHGTRFDLYFPISRQAPIPLAQFFNEQAVQLGNGETVVILEKERTLLPMYEEKLAALGYEPVGFPTLEGIVGWLKDGGTPDLVILDVASLDPSMTPVGLDKIFRDIPYLMIADQGRGGPMSNLRLKRSGALSKPVNSKSMASAISKIINRSA